MLKRGTVTLRDNFDQPLVGSASSSHVNALKLNRIMLQEDRQMINEHLGIVDPGEKVDAVVGEVDRPVGEGGYDFREAAGITDKILGKKRSEKAQAPPSTSLTEEAGEKEKVRVFEKRATANFFTVFNAMIAPSFTVSLVAAFRRGQGHRKEEEEEHIQEILSGLSSI